MFLFRATRGEASAGRSSVESQPAGADGRHLESDPTGTSERYEQNATSAGSLNEALEGHFEVWLEPTLKQVAHVTRRARLFSMLPLTN